MKRKIWVRIVSSTLIILLSVCIYQSVNATEYKKGYYAEKVKIGKSKYLSRASNGKYNIIRKKKGKTKVLIKETTGTFFLTNGKNIFYTNGKGKDYLGYRVNRLCYYNIKNRKSKCLLKTKSDSQVIAEGKKGKLLYYSVHGETTGYYIFNTKKHNKKSIIKNIPFDNYTEFKIKGKRIIIEVRSVHPSGDRHKYVFRLSGKLVSVKRI